MKNKVISILLSLAIAFGLWLYVITVVSPGSEDTYYDIPVVFDGETILSERGLMVTDISSRSVNVTLSGNRSDLAKVNRSNITVKASLSSIYEPGSKLQLNYTVSWPGDLPNNAFVTQSKNPASIYVTVERRVTKEVPVEILWTGSAPEGYISDKESSVLDYTSINVTGPESVINQIEKAVVSVDLTEQRESISQSFLYALCDKESEPVDAELVTTNVEEIHLDVRIQKVKDVTLAYNIVDGGGATRRDVTVTLSAETIRVSGSEAALDALGDKITVGTIDLADVPRSTKLTFPITLPEGITNRTGTTEVEADVQFKGLTIREIVIETIQSANVPEGMAVEFITEKLTVTVRGPTDLVNQLASESITATVDFSGAEAGTATFGAAFTFPAGFESLGVLKSDSVSATVVPAEE